MSPTHQPRSDNDGSPPVPPRDAATPTDPASGPDVPSPTPTWSEPSPGPVTVVWDNALGRGPGHPTGLQPARLRRAAHLLDAAGVLRWRDVTMVAPEAALGEDEALAAFHTHDYLKALASLSAEQASLWATGAWGFSEMGQLPFGGMLTVAGRYVAATRTAVRQALAADERARVVSLAGEQVHARRDRAHSGDVLNDVALALLDALGGGGKVAVLNLDAEHPGVLQSLFWEEPRLLLLSLHESGQFLYPGTGDVREIGEGAGRGRTVNLPLPPGAGDSEVRTVLEQVGVPLLDRFGPDLLVVVGGTSAHHAEPLAHLRLTTQGYQHVLERALAWAPRLVLLGGEGTDWGVSARLWTVAVATWAGRTAALPHQVPNSYAQRWDTGGRLWDDPLPPLSPPMQAYVTQTVHEMVRLAQRTLFPLWDVPLPPVEAQAPADRHAPLPVVERVTAAVVPVDQTRKRRLTVEEARVASQRSAPPSGDSSSPEDTKRRRRRGRGGRRGSSDGKPSPTSGASQGGEGTSGKKKKRRRRRRRRGKGKS